MNSSVFIAMSEILGRPLSVFMPTDFLTAKTYKDVPKATAYNPAEHINDTGSVRIVK